MRYRIKKTEQGPVATGDRERAAKEGVRYVDPKRFALIPALVVKKKKDETVEKTETAEENES